MIRFGQFLMLCGVWCVPSLLLAQGEPEKVATVEGVTEYRLANGARVLLFPEASQPTVTVNMTVLVGSRHEGYGEAGMAHLLEHMVFKGTPTFPDIPGALKDHGASYNGTTNSDRTNYFETLPATDKNLEFAIHMEADRLVNSYVRHEDLISEFTVVRNEFERGENSPQGILSQRITAAAFEWHNYGKSTIGNRSDIERVPIDNLQAFYRKYYQPDNVVLIVTGRFEEPKALELVNKYLGSIPAPDRKLDPTYTEEPPQDGERFVELRRVGTVGALAAAFHIPAAAHDDWAPLSILASVLNEDKVGLLEKELVESRIATSASARCGSSHDPDLFYFSVQPREDNLDEAREAMTVFLDSLGERTFDEEAVERAKLRARRQSERLMVDAGNMAQALSSASSLGDWRLLFLQRDRVADVTVDDVNRVVREYFPAHNRTVGVFVPTEEPRRAMIPQVASIEELVRDYEGGETIASGEAFDPSPANIDARTEVATVEGVKVAMLPRQTRGNTVDMVVTFRFGNEQSLDGSTTAAGMIGSMLMAGTKDLDRQALQERMTQLDVDISSGGGRGRGRGRRGGGGFFGGGDPGQLSFRIEAKRQSIGDAIALLGEILKNPAFPEDEFEQSRSRTVNGLKSFMTEPTLLASNRLSRAMSAYPENDVRYVPTLEETIGRMESVSLEQIIDIYRNQVSAENCQIAVVGDFEPEVVTSALAAIVKDWKSGVEYRSIERDANPEMTGGKEDIVTPDKANAQFSAGLSFPLDDEDPDAMALTLGNYILGGGTLSSRIGTRVRQKEGLSYGANSSMSIPSRGTDARFTISAITNPANMDAVETAVMEELMKFLDEGPTRQEVQDAITGWLESRKVSRSSDGSIASQLGENLFLDRSYEFISDQERQVAELTPEVILQAFRKHIDPDKLVIIRAGDFRK